MEKPTAQELGAALVRIEAQLQGVMARLAAQETQFHEAVFAAAAGIGDKIDAAPWSVLYVLSEKIDILLHHRHATDGTNLHVSREVDRLDGYLKYYMSRLAEGMLSKQARSFYSSPDLVAVLDLNGFDVVVPTSEVGLIAYLSRHGFGEIEPAVRSAFKHFLHAGCVAIDAGANVGLHSLPMAQQVGPSGSLLAFEALPHIATALERSLKLNGLHVQSRVRQVVLSDREGEATLYAADHSPMSSLFAQAPSDLGIKVKSTTLDADIPAGGNVDLIKLDIEGAEPAAWRGMRRVLSDNPEVVVIMEWSASHFARSGENAVQFMDEIQAAGFDAWILDDADPANPQQIDLACTAGLESANLLFRRRTAQR